MSAAERARVRFNGIANPNGLTGGAYEITSAPSNSSIIYMMVDGWIFKSTDKGATFNVTGTGSGTFFNSASTPVSMASNGLNRQCGRKMAIDPINPSIVYAGTDVNGMFSRRTLARHGRRSAVFQQELASSITASRSIQRAVAAARRKPSMRPPMARRREYINRSMPGRRESDHERSFDCLPHDRRSDWRGVGHRRR